MHASATTLENNRVKLTVEVEESAIDVAMDATAKAFANDQAAFDAPPELAPLVHAMNRLLDRVPSLKMWKDGQGDMRKYQRIICEVGDRIAWVGGIGDDCAPGYFAVGCQAYTSSISNIAPKLSLKIAELGLKGDYAGLAALMKKYVHPLYALRDRCKGYEVSMMKSAMEILGHPAGPVRPPLVNIKDSELAELRQLMEVYSDVI